MAATRSYLDYNASAPLLGVASEAIVAALAIEANPSSVHSAGRAARAIVEAARREIAKFNGGKAENVVFTSGATEAASTLLTPNWRSGRDAVRMSKLYVSAADHPCLLQGGRFAKQDVERIGVDSVGLIDLSALERALAGHDRSEGLPLVAIHAANNETGVVQPVAEIGRLVMAVGGVFVVDAVQAAGRIPLDISDGSADFFILSSHKIGGPKGVGAFAGASSRMMPAPLVCGGGQEKGHRGGTENVPGIAGFAAAIRGIGLAIPGMGAIERLRDRFEAIVIKLAPDATIFGAGAPRLPNTLFFAMPGIKAETAQIAFDLDGVALSAGSACSSGKVGPSHVLKAMGYGADEGALRVSIGHATSEDDLERFEAALEKLVARRDAKAAARAA